jgi:hypothetical protein
MSDKLEQYVKQNRDNFDILEPNAALWNKIETKLEPKSRIVNFSFVWKAAVILLVFGFSYWAQMNMEQEPLPQMSGVRDSQDTNVIETAKVFNDTEIPDVSKKMEPVMPEFFETEKFYSRKVNSTMKELNVYLTKYPDVAVDMKKDIAELDSVYRSLKRDLGDDVAHEEILKAMIQNYRMKLQILEDIKNELMQNSGFNSTKNDSHEI